MKEEIHKLHQEGLGYSEIASNFNISRQRVHQIITGYRTISPLKWKMKLLSEGCKKCSGKAMNIHHIDKNSHNNEITNLMPLCIKCHKKIHIIKVNEPLDPTYWITHCVWCRYVIKENNRAMSGCCIKCFDRIKLQVQNAT